MKKKQMLKTITKGIKLVDIYTNKNFQIKKNKFNRPVSFVIVFRICLLTTFSVSFCSSVRMASVWITLCNQNEKNYFVLFVCFFQWLSTSSKTTSHCVQHNKRALCKTESKRMFTCLDGSGETTFNDTSSYQRNNRDLKFENFDRCKIADPKPSL